MRLIVGGVFLIAGILKVGSPNALASSIAAFRLLPPMLVAPLAVFLPYFEIGLGGYLVFGFFTRAAAYVATVQLAVFAAAIASVVWRGLPASCGCFGPGDDAPATWLDVGRDIVLMGCAYAAAYYSPGKLSLDGYFQRRTSSPD